MQADLTAYADYYKQRHTGHVLNFDHALGTVTMKARFGPGIKELSVSLYQGLVLLLFNETRMGMFFCSFLVLKIEG
jgi:cullin-4